VGAPPPAAPAGGPRFVNVAAEAGLTLRNVCGAIDKRTINETVGMGVCLLDFDDDGRLDLFLPNGRATNPSPGEEPRSALYRNLGGLRFQDVTATAGVAARGYWAQGCAAADYDADGRIDLFLTGFGRYLLYRNLGGGRFQDVTRAAGLAGGRGWSTGTAFADYDGDGWLDLYVSHYVDWEPGMPPLPAPGAGPNCHYRGVPVICGPRGLKTSAGRLFRNLRGHFTDVSRTAGIRTDPSGYGLGVLWSDLDLDGDPELFVANDSVPNLLYRNDGRGRLSEIGLIAGAAYAEEGRAQAGMGVDAGDYDNDGRFDLFVTNFSHDYSTLRHNEGDLFFLDVSMALGVGAATFPTLGWGTGFLDHDNDGDLDLFVANGHVFPMIDRAGLGTTWKQKNLLLRNDGGRFTDVSAASGPGFEELHSARGAAFGDLDDDGDLDVVVNNIDEPPALLRNDGGNGGSWIALRLRGAPPNRTAVGARAVVIAGGLRQTAEVRAGSSHNSCSDPRLHFGLGKAARADRVEIRWRSGRTQVLENLPAGRTHVIEEKIPGAR
ncbi:MAG: CRTAC1 family protein, partial [Candidatus Polarisedimenticolia bacterium]